MEDEDVEYDPERMLWRPRRRGFISLALTAAVGLFVPTVPKILLVDEVHAAAVLQPNMWVYFASDTTMLTYSIKTPNKRTLGGVTYEPLRVSDLPMEQQQLVAVVQNP